MCDSDSDYDIASDTDIPSAKITFEDDIKGAHIGEGHVIAEAYKPNDTFCHQSAYVLGQILAGFCTVFIEVNKFRHI
jgi:hypothetical protein